MAPRCRQVWFLLVVVTLMACGTRQLGSFKQRWLAGDYTGIAQEHVTCETVDDVCGQLHLIKGDACFRLASQQREAATHYPCAAAELDKGLRYTKTWQQGQATLDRPQTYINLCESLRAWQDIERGARADQLTQHLLEASQRFLADEPAHPAAVYYNVSARYTQLRPALLSPRDPQGLCRTLNELSSELATALPRAGGTVYQASLSRLQLDLQGARRTISGCQ